MESDDGEGGEEDQSDQFNEEAEEEQNENPDAAVVKPEVAPTPAADTKIVESEIPDKKASDVLFEMESDENKDK